MTTPITKRETRFMNSVHVTRNCCANIFQRGALWCTRFTFYLAAAAPVTTATVTTDKADYQSATVIAFQKN